MRQTNLVARLGSHPYVSYIIMSIKYFKMLAGDEGTNVKPF